MALPENHPTISKAIAVGTVKREEDFYRLHRQDLALISF